MSAVQSVPRSFCPLPSARGTLVLRFRAKVPLALAAPSPTFANDAKVGHP
jgi:hypothetical protein